MRYLTAAGIFVYLRANVVVVGDIVQLKKVFLSKGTNFFFWTLKFKTCANKMNIPIFCFDLAFKSQFLFFLVSLVKVLSIRDSLPHLHSIVLYGEDEVPADVEASFSPSSSISPSMSDLVLQ